MLDWRKLRQERVVGWELVVVGVVELVVVRSQIDWLVWVGWVGWTEDQMVDHPGLGRRIVGWMVEPDWDDQRLVEQQCLVVHWRCWVMETVGVQDLVGCCIRQMDYQWEELLGVVAVVVVQDLVWPIGLVEVDIRQQVVGIAVEVDIHLDSFQELLVDQLFVRKHWDRDLDFRVVHNRIPWVVLEVHRHLVVDMRLELGLLVVEVHIDDLPLVGQVVLVDIQQTDVVRRSDKRWRLVDQQLWLVEFLHDGSLGELQCLEDSLEVVEVRRDLDSQTVSGRVPGVLVEDSPDSVHVVGIHRDRVEVLLVAVVVLLVAVEEDLREVFAVVVVDEVEQLDLHLVAVVVVVVAAAAAEEDLLGIQDLAGIVVVVEVPDSVAEVVVGCEEHSVGSAVHCWPESHAGAVAADAEVVDLRSKKRFKIEFKIWKGREELTWLLLLLSRRRLLLLVWTSLGWRLLLMLRMLLLLLRRLSTSIGMRLIGLRPSFPDTRMSSSMLLLLRHWTSRRLLSYSTWMHLRKSTAWCSSSSCHQNIRRWKDQVNVLICICQLSQVN